MFIILISLLGNEAVLFLRLHLLQGAVAFHQGKTLESTKLLNQANEELQKLAIKDGDLTQLISLGNNVNKHSMKIVFTYNITNSNKCRLFFV